MGNKLVFIKTDRGAEAVFVNGHMIACFENDGFSCEPVSYIAIELSIALNIKSEDYIVKHPDDEWSWDELYSQVVKGDA
ncbi:TPA: hypothetical protein ACGQ21_003794 [Escherichia coli]|uniref:hypothetical protein n=1 Tax=Escherichia marmotae TaxID=1499973 RepID=UPI00141A3F98|nr:hypothetical protein [Escherichia marmotae]EEW8308205.1 hypothetical protein [Escherichia coli]EFJ6771135.1 hypothetical protein [Escherichia coli]EGI8897462.1 hypothetical protein [Escherichia coli]EHX8002517.1 hypothetical protein [Escherichia coli]EKG1044976.1 hypothetical protein [Escherichia coli]